MEDSKEHRAGRLLTLQEVAEQLAISRQHLRGLIRSGAIPVVILGPRTRRIEQAALDDWIQSRRVESEF